MAEEDLSKRKAKSSLRLICEEEKNRDESQTENYKCKHLHEIGKTEAIGSSLSAK